jgi:hypothetical protein
VSWLLERTQGFPKSQRFVLAKRVQDAVLDFYAALIAARKLPLPERRERLLQADVALETLRLHLRLCYELKLLNSGQYEHVSAMVVEVGKLLGAWRKRAASGSGGEPVLQPED